MFCPNCKSEYRPEFKQCADCEVKLVAVLDPVAGTSKDSDSPIVVFTTSNYHEANLVKGLLEANEIRSHLLGGHLPTLNPFLTNAVGEIQIAVPESQAELANELLRTYRSTNGESPNFGAITPFSDSENEE